jgi:hypothetical protein
MPVISHTTFDDVFQHGFDHLGGKPSMQAKRGVVRTILESYRDLDNAFSLAVSAVTGSAGGDPQLEPNHAEAPRGRRRGMRRTAIAHAG